jgi:RHS repeat-associated protein
MPYGMNLAGTGGDTSPMHFTGKQKDTETGLDYFGARFNSSNLGRFMTPDWSAEEEPVPYAKLDDPQTLNLYGYVRNNPLSSTDPSGHDGVDILQGAINAFSSDLLGGAYRTDHGNGDHQLGQAIGDGLATVVGTGEALLGAGGEVAGLALDATGVGAIAGVPVGAISTAAVVQGSSAALIGGAHLAKSAIDANTGKGPVKADKAPGVTAGGQATDEHGNKIGPSGETQVNRTQSNTREGANNKALNEGSRSVNHNNPKDGSAPHFHPADANGKKKPSSTHHEYPK